MEQLVTLLFTPIAIVAIVLSALNVTMIVLRLTHNDRQAAYIARRFAPFAAYFRLGGKTDSDRNRSHA